MVWRAIWVGTALAACAAPALAQPAPDLGELSREFGAFGDADRADTMIRNCDDQARRVQEGASRWIDMVNRYKAEKSAYEQANTQYAQAGKALHEAEALAAQPGADPRLAGIVQERRARFLSLSPTAPYERFQAVQAQARAEALKLIEYFGSIGMTADEISGRPSAMIARQTDRCQRMRAWKQLGERSRGRAAQPVSGVWPGIVASAWQGQWSCQWRSMVNGVAQSMTVSTRVHVTTVGPETANVYLSTQLSSWPPAWPSKIFSPLEVRRFQPLRGAFVNRPELDEGRAGYDVVDAAEIASDGVLTFRRTHSADPGRTENLVCTRSGPVQPE